MWECYTRCVAQIAFASHATAEGSEFSAVLLVVVWTLLCLEMYEASLGISNNFCLRQLFMWANEDCHLPDCGLLKAPVCRSSYLVQWNATLPRHFTYICNSPAWHDPLQSTANFDNSSRARLLGRQMYLSIWHSWRVYTQLPSVGVVPYFGARVVIHQLWSSCAGKYLKSPAARRAITFTIFRCQPAVPLLLLRPVTSR